MPLPFEKIEHIRRVFAHSANCICGTFGRRPARDFIAEVVEKYGVNSRRRFDTFQIRSKACFALPFKYISGRLRIDAKHLRHRTVSWKLRTPFRNDAGDE